MNDELSQANSRGFELGRRHAALAEVIGQAALWACTFRFVTADLLPDGSAFVTSPLEGHAAHLIELWDRLGGACADLASSLGEGMNSQEISATQLSDESASQSTNYVQGAYFVRLLQSRSFYGPTMLDFWRTELTNASLYLSVAGICTDELERYAAISQALFNDASSTVRSAYANAVGATYGRIWARAAPADEGRVLVAWMKALADGGFSFDECVAELRDPAVTSPDAVSYCLDSKSVWLLEE
ncbi:hypothetical protein TUM20985_29180 [Mycobacterium antarcticum]|nr:hypothetical protein TUM20985_29180 [Mycolicibacterium sp. TUM20985]GLP84086.1 hypothetical protein TUM20984_55060 [Mycolicibacterium sp. TUM20984]